MKKLLLGAILLFSAMSCSKDDVETLKSQQDEILLENQKELLLPVNLTDNEYTKIGLKLIKQTYFDNSIIENSFGFSNENDFYKNTSYLCYSKSLRIIFIYRHNGVNAEIIKFNLASNPIIKEDQQKEILTFNLDYSTSPLKSIKIEKNKENVSKCSISLYQRSDVDSLKRFLLVAETNTLDFKNFIK